MPATIARKKKLDMPIVFAYIMCLLLPFRKNGSTLYIEWNTFSMDQYCNKVIHNYSFLASKCFKYFPYSTELSKNIFPLTPLTKKETRPHPTQLKLELFPADLLLVKTEIDVAPTIIIFIKFPFRMS